MRGTTVAEKKVWYRRSIKAHIEWAIAEGYWRPGQKIPTRQALVAYYEVSKHVIDGVIGIMIAEGTLVGGQGGRVRVAGGPDIDTTGPILMDPDLPVGED